MTMYNRPQVCFTPELQPEWLLALVCIFVGCICITTTIILLASSHWDRNVIPYARWVGFTASKCYSESRIKILVIKIHQDNLITALLSISYSSQYLQIDSSCYY